MASVWLLEPWAPNHSAPWLIHRYQLSSTLLMTFLDSTLDQGCFPTFLVTTESQYLSVTTKVSSSSHHLLHHDPIAATWPMLTVWHLSAGHVLGTVRKLLLPQRSPQLFSVSWRSPSASSYLLLSMQKLRRWACLLLHWRGQVLLSLCSDPGSLFSTWAGITLFMFPGSFMLDPHGGLHGSDWENASLKPLPIGNKIGPESQLLHFKIHHYIYSKTTSRGLSPVDGWGNRY